MVKGVERGSFRYWLSRLAHFKRLKDIPIIRIQMPVAGALNPPDTQILRYLRSHSSSAYSASSCSNPNSNSCCRRFWPLCLLFCICGWMSDAPWVWCCTSMLCVCQSVLVAGHNLPQLESSHTAAENGWERPKKKQRTEIDTRIHSQIHKFKLRAREIYIYKSRRRSQS